MEKKIKEYVEYHFRFDKRNDIDEIKKEMTSNLIDRYNDFLSEGKSKEESYIETIKYLGEVSKIDENVSDDINGKMNWAIIAMVTVITLAFSGALLSIFSSLIGLIVTLISIVLFATCSYYLYMKSQFERKEKFDIELQKVNMRIIMKNFRYNFLPWSISLAISFTGLVLNIVFVLTSEDLAQLALTDGLLPVVVVYSALWLISFLIIFTLLRLLERKLYEHYTYITGEEVSTNTRYRMPKGLIFSQDINWYLVFLLISTIGITLTYAIVIKDTNWSTSGVYLVLIPDLPILIVPVIVSIISVLLLGLKKDLPKGTMILINIINLLGYLILSSYLELFTEHNFNDVVSTSVIMCLVFLIICLSPIIKEMIMKKE